MRHWMKRFTRTAPAVLAAGLLAACGGDDDEHGENEHGLEEEFCEHFQNGPFQSVTASGDAEGAPDATFEHTRIDVTLTSTTGGMMGGWVHFETDEAGEFVIATSNAQVPMAVVHHEDGEEVTPERTETGDECGEVAMMNTYDLEMGRYDIWFGPTSESEVGMGFEEAGGHDHDHEGEDHDHDHDDDDHDHGG